MTPGERLNVAAELMREAAELIDKAAHDTDQRSRRVAEDIDDALCALNRAEEMVWDVLRVDGDVLESAYRRDPRSS